MHAHGMEIFVPGRLCLFGEHSDWAGAWRASHPNVHLGHCLVTGTQQGLRAEARALDEEVFAMSVPAAGGPLELRLRLDDLEGTIAGRGFFSYVAGVMAELRERYPSGKGLDLRVVAADLPTRKGLSSSAAACVLVARAFGQVHDLGFDLETEMELAFLGELRAGSSCGRMDQVCALGARSSFLTFDGDDMSIEMLDTGAPIHLLLVDLAASKDTRRILADLQACFPDGAGSVAAAVREALGPRNAELVHRARSLVEAGSAAELGELMSEAQAVFDRMVAPACPELAAPRLHAVLDSEEARQFAWGGKGVGSQGDGSAQFVARGAEEGGELARLLEERFSVRCLSLALGSD